MSQTAIPLEFERYLQNQISVGDAPDMNEMIFAHIPGLDPSQPINRENGLPDVSLWVHQQDIDQVGKLGDNALAYSVVIPGTVAEFTFNAIYLRDKNVPNSCGMVVHKAEETKENGMASTKSLVQAYDGAAQIAGITVDASTWQIDYQARLKGIEEDHRLTCLDNYAHTAFVDGFDVTQQADPNKYKVTPGVVYVGGLRGVLTGEVLQTITTKPNGLYVDVVRQGTALSVWENKVTIAVSETELTDYVDGNGDQHYVAKLAGINADGSVVDWRVKGGLVKYSGNQDTAEIGKTAVNVLSHSHIDVQAGDFVLIKTKIPKPASGDGMVVDLDIRGTFEGYTVPFQLMLGWYYYQHKYLSPVAVINKGSTASMLVKVGFVDGYHAFAISASYYHHFNVNLVNRTVNGTPSNWLRDWNSELVGSDAVAGFENVEVISTYNESNKPTPEELGAMAKSDTQFAPYDAERTYQTGEICTIEVDGEIVPMQMYAGPNLTCKGKDPSDIANRAQGWTDTTKPFWWIPYTGNQVGMPFFWLDTTAPEWAVMEINSDLPVAVYWRLAKRYPHLVSGGMINTGEIRGDVLRVLDQGRGVDLNRQLGSFQDATELPYMAVHRPGGTVGNLVTPPINTYTDTYGVNDPDSTVLGSGSYLSVNLSASGSVALSRYKVRMRNTARPMAIAI